MPVFAARARARFFLLLLMGRSPKHRTTSPTRCSMLEIRPTRHASSDPLRSAWSGPVGGGPAQSPVDDGDRVSHVNSFWWKVKRFSGYFPLPAITNPVHRIAARNNPYRI